MKRRGGDVRPATPRASPGPGEASATLEGEAAGPTDSRLDNELRSAARQAAPDVGQVGNDVPFRNPQRLRKTPHIPCARLEKRHQLLPDRPRRHVRRTSSLSRQQAIGYRGCPSGP